MATADIHTIYIYTQGEKKNLTQLKINSRPSSIEIAGAAYRLAAAKTFVRGRDMKITNDNKNGKRS